MSNKKQRETYMQGWKMYPAEAFGHHLQGAIVGTLVSVDAMFPVVIACLWTLLYIAYQGLSVIRKGDSAGLDVADFLVGFWVGIGLSAILLVAVTIVT